MTDTVPLDLSFDALVEAIKTLDLSQKGELLEILDDLLFDVEETETGQSASRICEFMISTVSRSVIPVKTGIHEGDRLPEWIPTCVGMTQPSAKVGCTQPDRQMTPGIF